MSSVQHENDEEKNKNETDNLLSSPGGGIRVYYNVGAPSGSRENVTPLARRFRHEKLSHRRTDGRAVIPFETGFPYETIPPLLTAQKN